MPLPNLRHDVHSSKAQPKLMSWMHLFVLPGKLGKCRFLNGLFTFVVVVPVNTLFRMRSDNWVTSGEFHVALPRFLKIIARSEYGGANSI